jgi:pilus assembly protein Flp/PilA
MIRIHELLESFRLNLGFGEEILLRLQWVRGPAPWGCIMKFVRQFIRDARGATAIEYGLIAGLIAVAIIGGVSMVGSKVQGQYNAVANKMNVM